MAVSTRVVGVSHSPLNTAKSFLLIGERVVVVDGGTPGGERRIEQALYDSGRSLEDVSLVLVTHGHPDHAGGAAAFRRLSGAPIAADAREIRYLERHERAPAMPTGLAGRLFLRTPLPHEAFEPFTPDVIVDDAFDLRAYGVDAFVHRSGGHTKGSLSVVVRRTGDVIAADLMAGGIGIGGVLFHGRGSTRLSTTTSRACIRPSESCSLSRGFARSTSAMGAPFDLGTSMAGSPGPPARDAIERKMMSNEHSLVESSRFLLPPPFSPSEE